MDRTSDTPTDAELHALARRVQEKVRRALVHRLTTGQPTEADARRAVRLGRQLGVMVVIERGTSPEREAR